MLFKLKEVGIKKILLALHSFNERTADPLLKESLRREHVIRMGHSHITISNCESKRLPFFIRDSVSSSKCKNELEVSISQWNF